MSKITVQFGSGILEVHCEDPDKVKSLAEKINSRISLIKSNVVNANDSKALFLVALLIQDELETLQGQIKNLESHASRIEELEQYNEYLLEIINHVSDYLEEISSKMLSDQSEKSRKQ